MKTFSIPQFNQAKFIAKMDKFVKRANKLNIPFGYTLDGTKESSYTLDGQNVFYTEYVYSVYGESPVINGYAFLAKIEPLEAGVNLVHSHNIEFNFESYRACDLQCEHCRINRYRKFYYLIQNVESSDVRLIGGNCLTNYLGNQDAESIAEFYAEYIAMDEDESEWLDMPKSSGDYTIAINKFLAYALVSVKESGYVSTKEFGKPSTKDMTLSSFFYNGIDKVIITDELINESDNILMEVQKELTNKKELNNYEYTLLTLIDSKRMKTLHAGYIVSILPLYNRMMETKVTEQTAKQESNHIGIVGEKIININAIVTHESKFENNFNGYTYLYKFNSDGNIITYFSSKDLFLSLGDNVTIVKATVKKHDSYNGVNQTVITRGTITAKE